MTDNTLSLQKKTGNTFTFVDRGSNPVRKVNILGLQDFHLGKATDVTDPEVLKVVKGHPCFRAGELDEDEMIKLTEDAAAKEKRRRELDAKKQAAAVKQNAKFKGADEED